jgi:hypothetical protein
VAFPSTPFPAMSVIPLFSSYNLSFLPFISIHSKNDTVVRQSLENCKELLNQSNTFIKGTVDKVKEMYNISKQTNGPEVRWLNAWRFSTIVVRQDSKFGVNCWSIVPIIWERRMIEWYSIDTESWVLFETVSSGPLVCLDNLHVSLTLSTVPLMNVFDWFNSSLQVSKDWRTTYHVKLLKEWANTHGKCVRQRTVRQETTSYKCGTLPLNMYVSTSIEGKNWLLYLSTCSKYHM